MNLTLSINDEVVQNARQQAENLGTSVNQLIRDYLEALAGMSDASAIADEFERMSREPQGDSRGWRFNRDELHERR